MIRQRPIMIALIVTHVLMGLVILHYKVRYTDAEARVTKQVEQTEVWKASAANLFASVGKQNLALTNLKKEQELKDAQGAVELLKAQREAEDFRARAKGIAARQKPVNVPVCAAAGTLFEEMVNGK